MPVTAKVPEVRPESFALVFEGGGAKGVAYIGALRAIEERGLHIGAVAGASAGAITAALIAAGYKADELECEIPGALHRLAVQLPVKGRGFAAKWQRLRRLQQMLSRLKKTGSALELESTRLWLEGLLRRRLDRKEGRDVTFKELYDKTGIELFIVGANVSRREQVVFSHKTTRDCQVAGAVLASSSIPGVFASGKLVVDETNRPQEPERLHTIVDGGVWANYPDFVFRDASFRERYELGPLPHRVIGFILDESSESISDEPFGSDSGEHPEDTRVYQTARFADEDDRKRKPRTEAILSGEGSHRALGLRRPVAALLAIGAFAGLLITVFGPVFSVDLLKPLTYLPIAAGTFVAAAAMFLLQPAQEERGRGRDHGLPRRPIVALLELAVPYVTPLAALIAAIVLAGVLWLAIDRVPDPGEVSFLESRSMRLFVGLVTLTVVFFLGFLGLWAALSLLGFVVLWRPLADWGWGVMGTYAAGPGAPSWRGCADSDPVVKVPVPRELGTLSFSIGEEMLPDQQGVAKHLLPWILAAAQESTRRQLDRIPQRIVEGRWSGVHALLLAAGLMGLGPRKRRSPIR